MKEVAQAFCNACVHFVLQRMKEVAQASESRVFLMKNKMMENVNYS